VDKPLDAKVRELLIDHRSHFCSQEEIRQLEKLMLLPGQKINHKVVGQPSVKIASMAGFSVPEDTTMLIVEIGGVGKEYPLSIEKLSPVICYYVVDGWEAGCELCIKIINHGGIGHTMTLHSSDARVIERFALEKPVMRVLINTPATHGAIGYTTGLAPALTLGCGTWGGSITADNVTPMHLLNIKRLAYETAPIHKSKTSEISPEVKVHWRYDEQYRYRPASRASSMISEETAKDKPKASVIPRPSIQTEKLILPDKKYGDGISEAQVQEIVKKFPRRTK
jgi:acetaldehyde dehydrogenase (acetylating)